jgi:membrane protein
MVTGASRLYSGTGRNPHAGSGTRSEGEVEADGEGQGWRSRSSNNADNASDISPKGWKDILLRIYHRISEDRIVSFAAAVTFYNLLAIFPAIAALVAIYGLFADPSTIGHQVDSLSGVLPRGAIEIVRSEADRVARQPAGTLHGAFLIGLAISLWSANAGTKAIFDALNVAYREDEKRGFFKLNAMSLAFTLGTLAFAQIALGAIVVLPFVLGRLGLVGAMHSFITAGKWPMLLVLVVLMLGLLYRFGPSRDQPRWRWVTWGSIFAALLWLGASLLFSWYAANFGTYNKTYGSLGAVVGFMTWIWLSAIVVLIGAMLNAEMEHKTAREVTKGCPQPLGPAEQ